MAESEKRLAEFIRDGAHRRTEQAFGDYFSGQNASCALGAAWEAMYRLPKEPGRPGRDLDWFFDCLDSVKPCPGGDGCTKRPFLAALIVHLNDDHKWSREQIAVWLEGDGKPQPRPA